MPEQFANKAFTTTSGGIDDTTDPVTFTVSNAASFPTTGNFRVKIDEELLLVTNVSGSSFTATRGVEGSPITSHDSGAGVRHIFTAGALNTAFNERYMTGLYQSKPSPGVSGRKYYCTDSPYILIDDGTDWLHIVNGCIVTPPVLSDFSWLLQGAATAVDTYGGIYMEDLTNNSASHQNRLLVKNAPSLPYTVILGYIPTWSPAQFGLNGFVWRESGKNSGDFQIIRTYTYDSANLGLKTFWEHFTYPNTSSGNQYDQPFNVGWCKRQTIYVKLVDDGTNRKVFYGNNPHHFPVEYYSISRTNFITPNQVGIFINSYNQPQACHFVHWKEM